MQVDRNLIIDLTVLESKRETGYRHPHCAFVEGESEEGEEQGHAESCVKNTHVQILELIEEIDSISWFRVCSLCMDVE
jgi:hypothetical protein